MDRNDTSRQAFSAGWKADVKQVTGSGHHPEKRSGHVKIRGRTTQNGRSGIAHALDTGSPSRRKLPRKPDMAKLQGHLREQLLLAGTCREEEERQTSAIR
jgi:hypothetical protein